MASVPHSDDSAGNTIAYAGYLLLGIGCLIPWNALISAADYFEARYPGRHADRLFSVCYLPTQLVTLLVVLRLHSHLNIHLRIICGYAGFTAVMIGVPMLEATSSAGAFKGILAFVVATGVLDGIAQGALYGEASKLPARYTQALVAGTAVSGALVSLLRILTKAIFQDTVSGLQVGAYMYFTVAALICLLCVFVFAFILPKLDIIQDAQKSAKQTQRQCNIASIRSSLSSKAEMEVELSVARGSMELPQESPDMSGDLLLGHAGHESQPASLVHVAVHTWPATSALVVIYTVTLAIFPGFLVEDISSVDLGSWYPVLLIAAFNVADLVGKSTPPLGAFMKQDGSLLLLLTCSLLRFLFVPAFLIAARTGAGPFVMGLLTVALGVSNGYLTAIAMMRAPSGLEGQRAELAGNLSVFALIGGLCVGAACSFLWLL